MIRALTLFRLLSTAIFALGIIGIAIREYYSYLVSRTFTVTETDRIYPVWGTFTQGVLIFVTFFIGLMLVMAWLIDYLSRRYPN